MRYDTFDISVQDIAVTDGAGNTKKVETDENGVYSVSIKTKTTSFAVTPSAADAKVYVNGSPLAKNQKYAVEFKS